MFDANFKLPHDTLDFDVVYVNLFPSLLLQKMFPPSPQDLHPTQVSYLILMRIGIAATKWLRRVKE